MPRRYRYDSVISHEVETPPEFRASSWRKKRQAIPDKPCSYTLVPARRVDCSHCGAELMPESFAGVSYAGCPHGCEDTFEEERDRRASQLSEAPASYDVQGRL